MLEDITPDDVRQFRLDTAQVVGHTCFLQADLIRLGMGSDSAEASPYAPVFAAFQNYQQQLTRLQKAAVKLLKGDGQINGEDVVRIGHVYREMIKGLDVVVKRLTKIDLAECQEEYNILHDHTLKIRSLL